MTSPIFEIKRLYANAECDQAGCSGGWASGYQIYKDLKLIIDKTPYATCFGSNDYSEENPYADILEHLGVKVKDSE